MKNRKKVCHIITKLELGGAQQNTLYTVEHLNRDIFEVFLICGRGGILDDSVLALAKTKKAKLFFVTHLIREINPFKDFLAFIEIFLILQQIKPDIVHTHSSKAGILGRWAAYFYKLINFKNVKIIHTFHGFGFSKFHSYITRFIFITMEFFTAIISDTLIFVSNDNIKTARTYKIGFPTKYRLIRSGIKIKDFYNVSSDYTLRTKKKEELNIKEDEIVITTIGPFKPQKNLKDFIKLAKILTERFRDKKIKFLIAGDGQQRELLYNMCKEFRLENHIKFLSWYKDIKGLLSITDIFVLTSLWEGLPRSAVEALVSGVPVVSYAVDGLNDIIIDDVNGYLVPPKDIDSLAKKVSILLTDKEKFVRIKNKTLLTIDNSFDIDYMVIQQENLYLGKL